MHTERYGCGIIIKKESKMAFPKTRETLPLKPTAESMRGKTGHYH